MFFKNSRRSLNVDAELERLPVVGTDGSGEVSAHVADGNAPSLVHELEARIVRLEAVRDALILQIEDARRQWEAECRLRDKQRREEQEYLAQYIENERRRHEEQLASESRALQEQAEADRLARLAQDDSERRGRLEHDSADLRTLETQAEADRLARQALELKVAQLEADLARHRVGEVDRLAREDQTRRIEQFATERPRSLEVRPPASLRTPALPAEGPRSLPAHASEPRPQSFEIAPAARVGRSGTWREEISHRLRKINTGLEKQFDEFRQFNDPEPLVDLRQPEDPHRLDDIKRAAP